MMAEKYDSNEEFSNHADNESGNIKDEIINEIGETSEEMKLSYKANDYIRELQAEKIFMDSSKLPNASRLMDQEITKIYQTGRPPAKDYKYVDIYREKPIKVSVKVLVPVREHPKFNFVGKLLGPKGNSMKRLQEETMCKMAVLGRGSMRDRAKEEELRQSLDPKYAHLCDDLHVEISALGPPAEAHARIAFALAEVRKYLIPDYNDNIRQEQLREIEMTVDDVGRNRDLQRSILKSIPRTAILPMRTPTRAPVISGRAVMPAKTKIMSILDRARAAMEQSYEYEDEAYDPAFVTAPSPTPKSHGPNYSSYDYEPPYFRESRGPFEPKAAPASSHWVKGTKPSSTRPRYQNEGRYRVSPYRRPSK